MSLTERQERQYKGTRQALIENHISLTKWQKGETKLMARVKALSAYKMAKRIYDREEMFTTRK